VAQRLTAALRAQDVVCRLGGDEFVFVVGGLGEPSEADRVGRNVLQAFEQPFEVNDILCPVKITLGYALAPHDDLRAAGLLKLADAAMYEGKRAGKGCLRRADPLIAPVDI
jgi:diguanylate cyclase (GGDEF)-like protein